MVRECRWVLPATPREPMRALYPERRWGSRGQSLRVQSADIHGAHSVG